MGVELFHDGKFLYCTTKQWNPPPFSPSGGGQGEVSWNLYTPLSPLFRGESKKTEIPIPQGYFSLALIGILLQMKCLRNQNNLHQKFVLERIFPFCRIAPRITAK